MLKNPFKKGGKCKVCQKALSGANIRIGYCDECAEKEYGKLKKRILISTVIGIMLAALVFCIYYYICSTYFISDEYGYKGDIFIPVPFGHLVFNAKSFNRIMNYTVPVQILLLFFCFCMPFSSLIQLEYKTHRHQAELDLYKVDHLIGSMAARTNSQRMDDAGMFIISLLLSAVSGPYFFVYRLYMLIRLADCKKALKRQKTVK